MTARESDRPRRAKLVIFTSNIHGHITITQALAKIGSATSAYKKGSDRLFVVDNGTTTAIYRFHSSSANASVSASELKLVALVQHVRSTSVSDYTFAS